MTVGGPAYQERRSTLLPASVWSSSLPGGPVVILPDGCMDLIWDGEDLFVAGPDTRPYVYTLSRSRCLAAVRFDAGVAPSVLGVRADELRDGRPDLADLWSRHRVRAWQDVVLRSPDPASALEALAARRLEDQASPGWVEPAVRLLRAGTSVERTAHELGMSTRQLRRSSAERFGYGPKLLQRILRVGDATSAIRKGRSLSDTAADLGFADYAHLHRESHALLGRSPVSFRSRVPGQGAGDSAA